jgi:hypothetical protein
MTVYVTNFSQQSVAMRTVSVSNLAATYSNGNGGFSATLTATGNGALSIDSVVMQNGNFVLVQNQSDPTQNGPYQVTDTGSVSTPFILMRASFFMEPQIASAGTFLPVGAGTVNAGSIWVLVEPIPVTMGSDPVSFVKA